ncbi:MAG: type VI secretion system protein TssA [Desulfovibrio sp.]|jgi:type VI secretion system protein VasJ|nr:type VI secretion system protein TssA [Desulfovibrio sp.]
MITESADFAALGEHPIPGGNPAGQDARYEPEYADVLAEIEKLSFPGQGGPASWPLIEERAAAILANTSKDIPMAAYLAVALCHNRGLAGLPAGSRLLAGLLTNFWETAWPPLKRMRGRLNAFGWWHEHVFAFLQEQTSNNVPVDEKLRQSLLEALAALEAAMQQRMPDSAPLRDLNAAVRSLPSMPSAKDPSQKKPPQVRQDSSSKPASPAPEPASDTAADAEAPPATDDPAVLRSRFVAATQAYLTVARRAEPANPALWRFSRIVLWSAVKALPQSDKRQTLLPAPDMEPLAQARQKLEAGNALDAAFAAEDFFATAPFCLDAQALTDKALSSLGPQFAEAARAVREECLRFVSALPGLEKLCFNDGSPFASPQTVTWLQSLIDQTRTGAETAASGQSGTGALARSLQEARDLFTQNKLSQALDLLDSAKADSPADNLRLRAAQLRLLCEAGEKETALALAEALLEESSARDLDNWDPGLALDVLSAARDAFTLFAPPDAPTRRDTARRIARLRPSATLG